ncbi:MAG: hypothetical protein HOW73_42275 [Polyangiaceae bacterium]|nr:hypothetical protein [Polyangiaceae bacterium]
MTALTQRKTSVTGARRVRARVLGCAVACAGVLVALAPRASFAGPGVSVQDATPAQKKEAQNLYEKGAKAFEQKKYDEAVIAFQGSYDVVKSPNAHMMLGRALVETNQLPRAYAELAVAEEEAKESERYAQTLDKIRSLRSDLAKKVALVRVKVVGAPAGQVLTARAADKPCAIDQDCVVVPGMVRVEVLEGTTVKATKDLLIAAGATENVQIDLTPAEPVKPIGPVEPVKPPPPPPSSGSRTGYLVSGGIVGALGLGAMGAGGALYAMAKSDHDDLEQACGADGKHCPAGSSEQIEDGRDKQAWSVIAFIAGGATASLGLGLIIAGVTTTSPSDDVKVTVGPGWVGVTSRF